MRLFGIVISFIAFLISLSNYRSTSKVLKTLEEAEKKAREK